MLCCLLIQCLLARVLKSMRCNVKTMFTLNTACTSCAAVPKMLPVLGLWSNHNLGLFFLRYSVKLGENTLSLTGCHHMCKKEIEERKCCPGFWGTECYECPGGSENPCSGHGTCLDGIQQNGTCICKEQYSGYGCQNCRDENRFGSDCQSECDCVHGECNSGVAGNGSCTCYGGYTGPRCDQELPLCKGVTCEANSKCVVRDGTAVCDCKLGYRKQGSTCQAQDPCTPSPCSPFAACKALGSQAYQCTCKEGFQGDGKICQPINPCVDSNGGCPENSTICVYRRPGEVRAITAKIGDGRSCYKDLLGEINQHNLRGRFTRKLNVNCGLPAILDGPGPFTVFVPSNDGVDRLRDGRLIYLFTEVRAHSTVRHPELTELHWGRILMDESGIPLNMRDIVASNGIIHTLDGIFIPPSIVPILPHRCNEEQHKIVMGSCVDCETLNNSICPPGSKEMEPTLSPKECVYIHDPQGLNVLKKGCARYCNQTVTKPGCCKGFFGPDCMPCPGGFSSPCYGRGNCSDGIQGNGNCHCFEGFKGTACHICANPNKHGENCDEDCACVHGVCDNRPGSGGVCQSWSCKEGYTGKFCDKTSKNCGPSGLSQYFFVAHSGAHCHLINLACLGDCSTCVPFVFVLLRCICMDGYEGDGFSCQPIDLCSQPERGGCSQNALCTSTGPGTATCQCNVGWTGDGKACVPIDNCMLESRGNCHLNADCVYIGPGQSKCVCKRGYAGDGHSCDAINPCLMDNGGCHDLVKPAVLLSMCCAPSHPFHMTARAGWLLAVFCTLDVAMACLICSFLCFGQQKSLFSIPAGTNVTVLVPSEAAIKNLSNADKDFWLTPYTLPFLVRAHFLEGVFTAEKLRKYDRPELPTLNPQTRWQINTTSGVRVSYIRAGVQCDSPQRFALNPLLLQVLLPAPGDIPPSPPGLQEQLNAVASFSTFKELLEVSSRGEPSCHCQNCLLSKCPPYPVLGDLNLDCLVRKGDHYHIVLGEKLLPTDLRSGIHKNSMLGLSYWLMFYQNNTQVREFVNNIPLDGKSFETKNGILIGVSQVLVFTPSCLFLPRVVRNYGYHIERGIKQLPQQSCTLSVLHRMAHPCLFLLVFQRSVCCPGYYGHMCEMCPGKPGQWCSGNGECQDGIQGSGECRCLEGFHGTACEMCEVGRYGADCKSECACDNGICNDGLRGDGSCECFPGWTGPTCQESTCSELILLFLFVVTEIDPCTIDHGGCSVHAVCTKVSPGERTCVCKEGYAGDGTLCMEIDLCLESNGGCHTNAECIKTGPKKVSQQFRWLEKPLQEAFCFLCQNNGGCSPFGFCKYTGPGTRNCSCSWHSVGDGFTCRGKVHQVRGMCCTFCVHVPCPAANHSRLSRGGLLRDLLRYHMVGCQKLLSSDLEGQESLTSLSGLSRSPLSQNSITLNEEAKVVTSDIVGVNGVIHFISKILIPSDLAGAVPWRQGCNITDVAEAFGYTIYSKLLQDAELLPLLGDPVHRPFTLFWPTDAAFSALPESRQKFLYRREHRDVLASFLKAHMIRDTKIVAGNVPQVKTIRTMHGSTISFSCSKTHVGEIVVGNGDATITQRHIEFNGGIAHGIDRLLEPPDLGSRCDEFTFVELQVSTCDECGELCVLPVCSQGETRRCYYYGNHLLRNTFLFHRNSMLRPVWPQSPWDPFRRHFSSRGPLRRGCRRSCVSSQWVPQCCANHYGRECRACPGGLEAPCNNRGTCDDKISGSGICNCSQEFIGTGCELCAPGRYGPECRECNCTENGVCNGGLHGDGFCFCAEGWTGDRCETRLVVTPTCSPPCHAQAVCRAGNLCECDLHYEGDGRTCSVIDMCSQDNGGCARHAQCSQTGVNVSCTCGPGYRGDGYICEPIDRCADGRNGDCSQHAHCISTGPNERRCECKRGYVGDGIQCLEEVVPPTDRCLENNGQCHREAICTDLHFHDKTMGVFHLQSPRKKYDFTYEQAQAACAAEGASLATFQQLAAAQQMGFHLCLVGWLDNGTAGYPTAYPNPSCGSSHVGIVDYGSRSNLSETWDAFCYREKDVTCTCRDGFVGDGYWCSGKLPDVLADQDRFSTFYSMLLNFANDTEEGLDFFMYLSDASAPKTLFVPLNSGFADNETLTGEELKLHVSSSNVVLFSFNLTTGTIIPSQSGYDLHVSDLPASNSTEHAVGLAVAEGKKSPQVFTTSLLKQGMMGSLSGRVTSSVSCAVGRQGDQ
uniref:Uncharacterized protein n=1 Tax=Corvus moneduloides TaxID=1196302 RepID=A0A8C3H2Z2_CORMO